MFSREGAARTEQQNRLVAGCLAAVGGFVNSSGFVLVGTFTSHVTGNVGRLANDLAQNQYAAAIGALTTRSSRRATRPRPPVPSRFVQS